MDWYNLTILIPVSVQVGKCQYYFCYPRITTKDVYQLIDYHKQSLLNKTLILVIYHEANNEKCPCLLQEDFPDLPI